MLVIADLHLGKINHFRRAGVAVPPEANRANMETLVQSIMRLHPEHVVFLGDLFHSHYNSEWEILGNTLAAFPGTAFTLIKGNHDILSAEQYAKHRICVESELLVDGRLMLRHDVLPDHSGFQVCGHIHPGLTLRGNGRASETFPCFWFGTQTALLPAFGAFTGLKRIRPRRGDKLFIVAEGRVVEVS